MRLGQAGSEAEMDQEREFTMAESGAIEISSGLWVKILMAPLLLFCLALGVLGAICAICPQLVEHRPDKLPDVWMRLFFLFVGGPLFSWMGFNLCQPCFYRLRADAYGITESLNWKEKRVFWSDVHSYTLEHVGSRQEDARRHARPALRDAQGTVLFRPLMLVSDEAAQNRFWSFMQARLPGKELPFTPPPPIPSLYDGKSTAWKVKHAILILFCILAFVGLWSAAMLWTTTQPHLPRWAELTIAFAVFWVPYLAGALLVLATNRRQKKLQAVPGEESASAST